MSTLRANELKKLDDTNWVGAEPTQVPTNDMLDTAGYKTEDELNAAGYKTEDELNDVGFAQSVDSVSTLRTSTFPASLERLWLSGYYGVGTAGGRELYADRADTASADDGTDVFVDAGGVRWRSVERYYDADYAARLQAVMDAEWIRRNAGVPSWVTVGLEAGASPGLTNASALVSETRLDLNSEADVSTAADSGSGTKSDPYIIENRRWNNSEATFRAIGLNFTDDIYVEFRNCEISGDYSSALIQNGLGGVVTFQNCFISADATDVYQLNNAGTKRFVECVFGGGTQGRVAGSGDIEFLNCVVNDSGGGWASNHFLGPTLFYPNDTFDGVLDIRNTEFLSETININICPYRDIKAWRIESCVFAGAPGHTHIGGNTTLLNTDGLIKYCRFSYSSTVANKALIYLAGTKRLEIAYCDFEDTPDEMRQVWLHTKSGRASNVRDSIVHHCKFNKVTGSNKAGNECLETWSMGENVEFAYNWAQSCPEDAFEHAAQYGGCSVHHCVADNTVGQAVDIYKARDEDGNTVLKHVDCHVHHIYGKCGDFAVIVDDADGVHVHSIFVDNSDGSRPLVRVRNRDIPAGEGPNNCSVVGPLSLPRSIGSGKAVQIDSNAGTGNTAIWQEGGRIRRIGQSAEEEGRTQIV